MTTANNRSAMDGPALAGSTSSRNVIIAANTAAAARYPNRATAYVTARKTTATTSADGPVGCQIELSAEATRTPTAMPATRPTQRVYVCAVSGRSTMSTVSAIQWPCVTATNRSAATPDAVAA